MTLWSTTGKPGPQVTSQQQMPQITEEGYVDPTAMCQQTIAQILQQQTVQ